MLQALEKTLKAKSGLKQCGNKSWKRLHGVALGIVVAEVRMGTLEGGDPQDRGITGRKGRWRGGSGTPEAQDHRGIAQIVAIPWLQPVLGVASGVPILQRSGSSARPCF